MSAGTPTLFIPAKKKLLTGGFNISADALKAALTSSTQALSVGFTGASGDARYADLTAELATGNGYTAGGQALAAVVLDYYVASATIVSGGAGGTTGTQTVTGTTGTGTKAQLSVTVAGGVATAVSAVPVQGSYTALPTNPTAEPFSGGGFATNPTFNLTMGISLTFTNPSWASSTVTAKYIVFYDNTQTNKDLLAFADLETTQPTGVSTTNGTLTYQLNAAGLFQLQ